MACGIFSSTCLPPSAQQPCSVLRRIRRMLDTGGPRGVASLGGQYHIIVNPQKRHGGALLNREFPLTTVCTDCTVSTEPEQIVNQFSLYLQ